MHIRYGQMPTCLRAAAFRFRDSAAQQGVRKPRRLQHRAAHVPDVVCNTSRFRCNPPTTWAHDQHRPVPVACHHSDRGGPGPCRPRSPSPSRTAPLAPITVQRPGVIFLESGQSSDRREHEGGPALHRAARRPRISLNTQALAGDPGAFRHRPELRPNHVLRYPAHAG